MGKKMTFPTLNCDQGFSCTFHQSGKCLDKFTKIQEGSKAFFDIKITLLFMITTEKNYDVVT